ncbi:hypothetical protein DIPPA_26049 [Diplonema papillatum]|nr:hypothetical protein DIPPA_26049 [Diplonema papillatum]
MTDPSPKDAVTDCSSGTPPGTPPALGEDEPHVAPWTATHGQQEQKKLGDPARMDGVNLAVERSFGELTVATGCSGGSGANLKKVTISESMSTGMRSHDSIGRRSAGKRPRSPPASMCKHKLH